MLIFVLSFLFAKEAVVFDVRKTLQMHENQEVFHDYYINAGKQDGLKKKMLLTITRKDPFKDANLTKIEEDLVVDVADVELIHVQNTFSIARLKKIHKGLVLEFDAIMIGDRIDLGTARMPSSEDAPVVADSGKQPQAEQPQADQTQTSPQSQSKPQQKAAATEAAKSEKPQENPLPARAKEKSNRTSPSRAEIKISQEPVAISGELGDRSDLSPKSPNSITK